MQKWLVIIGLVSGLAGGCNQPSKQTTDASAKSVETPIAAPSESAKTRGNEANESPVYVIGGDFQPRYFVNGREVNEAEFVKAGGEIADAGTHGDAEATGLSAGPGGAGVASARGRRGNIVNAHVAGAVAGGTSTAQEQGGTNASGATTLGTSANPILQPTQTVTPEFSTNLPMNIGMPGSAPTLNNTATLGRAGPANATNDTKPQIDYLQQYLKNPGNLAAMEQWLANPLFMPADLAVWLRADPANLAKLRELMAAAAPPAATQP